MLAIWAREVVRVKRGGEVTREEFDELAVLFLFVCGPAWNTEPLVLAKQRHNYPHEIIYVKITLH